MKIRITVSGCDDSTRIELEHLTIEEVAFLEDIADKVSEASTYGCMPKMSVEVVDDPKG